MPVDKQIVSIFAVTNGYLDGVAVADVRTWESEFHHFLDATAPEIGEKIRAEKVLSKSTEADLRKAIERFSADFLRAREIGGGQAEKRLSNQ